MLLDAGLPSIPPPPEGGGPLPVTSIDRTPGDHPVVDDVLWGRLTAAVASAALATLNASRIARMKADRTPVTDADECSQAVLLEALDRLMPGVAVVSEEMAVHPKRLGDLFVLIDPLDGTKEFVRGSSEYTVNLAVMKDRRPAAGIVAVPASGAICRGRVGYGAEQVPMPGGSGDVRPLKVRAAPRHDAVAQLSRSHLDAATVAMLDGLHVGHRVPCGSSLKFCRIAEGSADVYPRLSPTREWDIAAGHALIVAAGGAVTRPDGGALLYGDVENDFRVPGFVAWGDQAGLLAAACK